jgi:hypothetical protein
MMASMKTTILALLLLAAVPVFAKHPDQQGAVVETHTENAPETWCWATRPCQKTAALVQASGHIYHLIGTTDGYWPSLRAGDSITFFLSKDDMYIRDGKKYHRFFIQQVEDSGTQAAPKAQPRYQDEQ